MALGLGLLTSDSKHANPKFETSSTSQNIYQTSINVVPYSFRLRERSPCTSNFESIQLSRYSRQIQFEPGPHSVLKRSKRFHPVRYTASILGLQTQSPHLNCIVRLPSQSRTRTLAVMGMESQYLLVELHSFQRSRQRGLAFEARRRRHPKIQK